MSWLDRLRMALFREPARRHAALERTQLLLGRALAERHRREPPATLAEAEFRVFSQFGDDGIIQHLIAAVGELPRTFIEFGVEDYHESNTRFLLMNDNWSGLVMDGSPTNVARIRRWREFWKYDLQARAAFITRENVDELLGAAGFGADIGLLHIDIDGNDYWVWEAVTAVRPVIAILEYNAVFGPERAITVPYDAAFQRRRAHASGLYWGASLAALCALAQRKDYAFVGCNSGGNNAYFVQRGRLGGLRALTPAAGYVESKFRESRDAGGGLTYLRGTERLAAIRGMPVIDVISGAREQL